MATKPGFVNINITISIAMRDALKETFEKMPKFWKNVGEMFASMAGTYTRAQLDDLKHEFPLPYEFVEECL